MSQTKTMTNGAYKAAVVLASMDIQQAASVMRLMSAETQKKVTAELRMLGLVTNDKRDAIVHELSKRLEDGVKNLGGDDVAMQLLVETVGDESRAVEMMDQAQPKKPQLFSAIYGVNSEDLSTLLSKEQPATAAIVMAHLPPDKAANVMSFLETDFRQDIASRLVEKKNTDPEIVEQIERIFVTKVSCVVSSDDSGYEQADVGGSKYLADMMQHLDKSIEEEVFGAIEGVSQSIADEIRDMMFTFEDLAKLADPDIQKILREVPMEKLLVALRGCSVEVTSKFTNNLSKRARENFSEEMEMMGKVKLSEVKAQRKSIIEIVRSLEAAGEIDLSGGDEGGEYV